MILHIIVVTYNRPLKLKILIDSFLVQTCPCWDMLIVHDGPASDETRQTISLYKEYDKIRFIEHPERLERWGHPLRKIYLQKIKSDPEDFILITNDDNYYMPIFVELMLDGCRPNTGIIYCDTVHNYFNYSIMKTEIKVNKIDIGSFIVRGDVAKVVGFKYNYYNADGRYAVECARYCDKRHLTADYCNKLIFIHN